jgi:hypothetical protein
MKKEEAKAAHRAKVQQLREQVRAARERAHFAAPWSYQIVWRIGWLRKPPLFTAYWVNVVVHAASWLATMLAMRWVMNRWFQWSPVGIGDLVALTIGAVIVGVLIATGIRDAARRLMLPPWSEY